MKVWTWPKILVAVLCLVLLVFLYYFVSPFVAYVEAQHPRNLEEFLTAVLSVVFTPIAENMIGSYYPIVLVVIGAVAWVVIGFDIKHRVRTTHGTAAHASRADTRRYRIPRSAAPAPRPVRPPSRVMQALTRTWTRQAFYLLLGRYKGGDIVLREQQQYQHLLLTAPTGAGKSARFFIPNLLRETGIRSLFVADLKNELYKVCAGWLSQSMQIWLFAPLKPTISAGYNPLAHIHSVEDAQDFAETWVANTGKNERDSFWETNSKLLISAMALHLLATEKHPPLSRLADMLTTRSYEEIRDTLRGSRSQDVRRIVGQFLENMEKNDRMIGSQMADVGNRFQLLASPNARAVTATNDIDFDEMIRTPTAFFLSIPRKATRRYRPLMACLTQQMFAAWEERGTGGVGCYLDEFTNLGYIPGYAEFISTARALRISLLMAIQSFSQLDERYGRHDADTIKANAVTHLLLPGAGLEECRYYSERIGDTTVRTETVNRRGYGLSEEITVAEGEARRRLMTADEIRRMPEDQMLMLEAKSAPLLVATKLYFLDKKLAERANWPYHVTQVRAEPMSPPTAPSAPRGLPPAGGGQQPPIVVDAEVEVEDDDDMFFQPE